MALTNLQKHLVDGLHIFGVEKDAILGIVSAMETEEQQCRLMEWMSEHEDASTADILGQVVAIISGANPEDILRDHIPIPNRFRRAEGSPAKTQIDAQFLEEASEAHQKAEEDGTLYERTRPRAGMRSGEPIKSLEGVPLPTDTEMFLGSLPSQMPDRFRTAKRL